MPAEILREAGFQTVGLYRNGWVAPTFGFDQGFEVYQRPAPSKIAAAAQRPARESDGLDRGHRRERGRGRRGVPAHQRRRQRWFLYLHLMDLHEYIYDAGSALFGVQLLGHLRQLDPLDRRHDRGPARVPLRNRVYLDNTRHRDRFGSRRGLPRAGIRGACASRSTESRRRFPSCCRFPFRLDPGIVVAGRSRNVDIWPTLLDLLGIEPPDGIDGLSRLPDILSSPAEGTNDGEIRTAIADLDQTWGQRDSDPLPAIAVVEGTLRYVRAETRAGGRREQLFDARDDPRELRDLAADEPETLERLSALADDYYATEPSWGAAPTRELDELELNLLRALGYKIE